MGESFHAKAEPSQGYTSSFEIPAGRWRNGIFDCFAYGSWHAPCWLACFFDVLALGQLMTRLNLNALGKPARSRLRGFARPFYYMAFLSVTVFLFAVPYYASLMENPLQQPSLAFYLVVYPIYFYVILLHTRTRNLLRRKYKIGTSYGCVGDCCCAYWCLSCSLCQMMNHTADYRHRHKARCCTDTGLDEDVEPLVPFVTSSSSAQVV